MVNSAESLIAARDAVVARYGIWTAHKIDLGHGVFTTDKKLPIGFPDVVGVINDFPHKPFSEMRVLDLACLEGGHSIEFARHGCEVVGIEGREGNVAKSKFARDALNLTRLDFFHDDVRNLSVEKYGVFDLVICSGIFYHLDWPDCFHFMEAISRVCSGLLYLNTHFVGLEPVPRQHELGPEEDVVYGNHRYYGRPIKEHSPFDLDEHREQRSWASIGNDYSFWLNKESLRELVHRSGFSRIYECLSHWHVPYRGAFIALK